VSGHVHLNTQELCDVLTHYCIETGRIPPGDTVGGIRGQYRGWTPYFTLLIERLPKCET
jgi:hypothetical protein